MYVSHKLLASHASVSIFEINTIVIIHEDLPTESALLHSGEIPQICFKLLVMSVLAGFALLFISLSATWT